MSTFIIEGEKSRLLYCKDTGWLRIEAHGGAISMFLSDSDKLNLSLALWHSHPSKVIRK